jgi:Nucleotidyltransferase domain
MSDQPRQSDPSGPHGPFMHAEQPGSVSSQREWAALVNRIFNALRGDSLAVMLYGSHARGTHDDASDIDVLQLVPSSPKPYSHDNINITAYTPAHIRQMAVGGSPFILHLLTEGRVLIDRTGVLQRALHSYRRPADYEHFKLELGHAAAALDVPAADIERYGNSLGRLGVYLVRTAAYIQCIEHGSIAFDLQAVAELLRMPCLDRVLQLRNKQTAFAADDFSLMIGCLDQLLPDVYPNAHGTLATLAVHLSANFPHAAALLGSVLAGGAELDYAAIALPPL